MKETTQIIAGRKPVLDAIESGASLDKVMIDQKLTGEVEIKLRNLCKEKNIPLQRVPVHVLDGVSKAMHQGVVAQTAVLDFSPFEDTLDQLMYEKGDPVFLVLDQVSDVRNLGAIARSAELLGVSAIILPEGGSAKINEVTIKASAGALLNIPLCRVPSLLTALKHMKLHGISVVVTDVKSGKSAHESDLSGPLALVVGSEEKGVRPHLMRNADSWIHIPQIGQTESYNVSVATGILLYEIARQRNFKTGIKPGNTEQ